MLWLSRRADKAKEITFLNMDALREGHNYDDELTHMHLHYHSNFRRVLKAIDIARLGISLLFDTQRPLLTRAI